jgi:hypothetical protein
MPVKRVSIRNDSKGKERRNIDIKETEGRVLQRAIAILLERGFDGQTFVGLPDKVASGKRKEILLNGEN